MQTTHSIMSYEKIHIVLSQGIMSQERNNRTSFTSLFQSNEHVFSRRYRRATELSFFFLESPPDESLPKMLQEMTQNDLGDEE